MTNQQIHAVAASCFEFSPKKSYFFLFLLHLVHFLTFRCILAAHRRAPEVGPKSRANEEHLSEGGTKVTKYRAQFTAVHSQAHRTRVKPNNTAKQQQQQRRRQQQQQRPQSLITGRHTPLVVVCVVSLVVRAVEAAGWRWAAFRTTRWSACP